MTIPKVSRIFDHSPIEFENEYIWQHIVGMIVFTIIALSILIIGCLA